MKKKRMTVLPVSECIYSHKSLLTDTPDLDKNIQHVLWRLSCPEARHLKVFRRQSSSVTDLWNGSKGSQSIFVVVVKVNLDLVIKHGKIVEISKEFLTLKRIRSLGSIPFNTPCFAPL